MSQLNKNIKQFTPEEYKELNELQRGELIENNIPFLVMAEEVSIFDKDIHVFENGIEWDFTIDRLTKEGKNPNDKRIEIELTKLEKKFLRTIILGKGEIISYPTINAEVWGKKPSIYTLRNIVNKIRNKTYYNIIDNVSNKGYRL